MAVKLSFNAKTYYLSSGSRATWNATVTNGRHVGATPSNLAEISNIGDLEWPLDYTKFDATTRAGGGFAATLLTIAKTGFDIKMLYDLSDAALVAIDTAAILRTTIALAILSGSKATAGEEGIWADFAVTKVNKGEKLEDAQIVTYSFEFGVSAVPPELVKVA